LERLKPSLEKHVGCDIVDINPGVAVWSTKLHQFLKPRNHILLEPDDKLYNQFLKPLLDAPDSKYTLIPKSGIVWRQLEEVLTENNLPFQKAYEPNDPQLEEPNNTLLVVANLGFHPRKPYRGFESIASLVLHQLLDSVRSHSLFQRYGLVRMLIWVGDGEQTKVLPKTINQRRKSCVEAEITCGSIREIASSTHFSQKNCIAELAGIDEILKKMELRGITTPSNRASDTLRELKKPEGTGSKNVKFSKEFLAKLADLEERFRTGKIKKNLDDSHLVNTDTQSGIRLLSTPEYALLCNYRRQRKSGQSIPNKTQALVDEYILITGLQRAWFLARSQTEKDTLMESITVRRQALHDELESHDPAKIKIVTGLVDSSQASQIDPPLLLWESRDNEPLKVHPSEFYPAQEMALLDLQPKALWSILRKDYPNNYETFHFLLGQLMVAPRQPLKRGLEALAPGAFEWLIERCPLLTDPTRGGTLDTNDFRVRNLTTDMLRQMIEAWVDWPFKPSRYELIARAGSSVFDPDSLDDGLGGGGTI
jgi:transcription factor 1